MTAAGALCAYAAFDACAPEPVAKRFWTERHREKLAEIAALPGGEADLVFIGDSLTHIWDVRCPDILTELKREYTLLNLGYSGDTTANVIWRIGEGGELDGYRAKCVMLEIGTNNRATTPPEDTAAAIRRILDMIAQRQPQATTILLPIFPRRDSDDGRPRPRPNHDAVNAVIRGFADGRKVVWRDFSLRFLDADGDTRWIMPDRLHPEAPGLRIWYDEVKDLFREICGKPAPQVTAGWEDVCTNRWRCPVTDPVWRADFADGGAFTMEKHGGAEGRLEVLPHGLTIRKTNAKGYLVVHAREFADDGRRMLLMSADVAVRDATPACSQGFLRACGADGSLAVRKDALKAARTYGWPEATDLINTAPGMTFRKYVCCRAEEGSVRPAIVVAGEPSVSEWSGWIAEDDAAARSLWMKSVRDPESSPKRLKPELVPDADFDRMIAADVQHTAKVESFGGGTRMLIDGRPAVPTLYEGMRHLPDYTEVSGARGLLKAGVRIVAPWVVGSADRSKEWSVCWTPAGYDAVKAVDRFRETMRASGGALMAVCYDCNAYPEFAAKNIPTRCGSAGTGSRWWARTARASWATRA